MPQIQIHDFYPHTITKRYGGLVPPHRGIEKILEAHRGAYESILQRVAQKCDYLLELPFDDTQSRLPCWNNGFFPFLDIVALIGIVDAYKPRKVIDIGSGFSTKVSAFARDRLGLEFEIVSIDPDPRSEVRAICDRQIKKPLQVVDLALFDELGPADILFFDGSHRVLQNSDNEILFFDILPNLCRDSLIHIHDIAWPHDYPEEWNNRYYNEQYVLGAMLLYAAEKFEILFPAAYVCQAMAYEELFARIWNRPGFELMERHGCSFWFKHQSS